MANRKLDALFAAFHEQNPHVYELFIKFSRAAKARGFKRYSAEAIVQRIRWHTQIDTVGDDFKINNWFRARYSRKLMADFPSEFSGFFETRERRK